MPKIASSERDAFYEQRRTEIADAALRLWAEKGFDQGSVAAIAREAGVAKGTFYLYFESKEALLLEVLRRNSLVPNLVRLAEDLQTKSLEEAVRGFVGGAWRHLADHRELLLVALGELPTHLHEAGSFVERIMAPGNAALAGFLDSRIPAGRAISSVIAVRSLVGMVFATFLTQEVLGAGRFLPVSEADITHTIAEIFLRGVAPESEVHDP